MAKPCKDCGCELTVGINWPKSKKEQNYYLCTSCNTERGRAWREANKDKIRKRSSEWVQNNLDRHNARCQRYRARKIQRMPLWANKDKIQEFYMNRPEGYEVDHIIPLKGKLVSGLHVHENLQYLTVSENRSKGNAHG